MLAVSQAAGDYLARLLVEADAPEDKCIRIASKGDHLTLQFDEHEPGDAAYSHDGKMVLVVDEALAQRLDGRQIAVEQHEGKSQLVLT